MSVTIDLKGIVVGGKMKSHSGSKKRFKTLGSGKIKRKQKGKRHLLSNKSSKRKRQLTVTEYVHQSDRKRVSRMLKGA